jgi:5-methylcytosine-specific restriction endonuclease McrA
VRADPKPQRRIRDTDLMRLMHREPTRECLVTGATTDLELHHVLPRSSSGDDVRANLVFLHRDFHRSVTLNDETALRLLGERIWEERFDTVAYLVYKLGKDQAVEWMRRRLLIKEIA